MIDRAIVQNPNKPFDFFNDYKDTLGFLMRFPDSSEHMTALNVLEKRYLTEKFQTIIEEGRLNGLPVHIVVEQLIAHLR